MQQDWDEGFEAVIWYDNLENEMGFYVTLDGYQIFEDTCHSFGMGAKMAEEFVEYYIEKSTEYGYS